MSRRISDKTIERLVMYVFPSLIVLLIIVFLIVFLRIGQFNGIHGRQPAGIWGEPGYSAYVNGCRSHDENQKVRRLESGKFKTLALSGFRIAY